MKIFWAPQTRSTRAIWMLEEAGVDYEMELIDIRSADRKDSKEFLAASPMGKVPAIVDGDVAMSESAAICIYVADRYAAGKLAPAIDDASRGQYPVLDDLHAGRCRAGNVREIQQYRAESRSQRLG